MAVDSVMSESFQQGYEEGNPNGKGGWLSDWRWGKKKKGAVVLARVMRHEKENQPNALKRAVSAIAACTSGRLTGLALCQCCW